jgi:hypothetical protein
MITRLILLAAGFAALTAIATPAAAWDTAPWNATPFDQANQLSADAAAQIARVEAEAMARTRTAQGSNSTRRTSVSSLVTDGQRGCSVNLGNVVLPQDTGGGAKAVSTNVEVKGDVITVCR